jgi:prolipoprotein diacylglyceryltransferase
MGCGVLFGLVGGAWFAWSEDIKPAWLAILAMAAIALLAGWAAGRWGSRFWSWVLFNRQRY